MTSKEQLEKNLAKFFGYHTFREGQAEIIQQVLNKQHVLAVLPTGSGKSVCYQLPAMTGEEHVIVISPLLSLMSDQVKQVKATGFKKVAAINSLLTLKEKRRILSAIKYYKLIYLSPEMLQSKEVIHALSALSVKLLVIDEAHCISQWGHEFRPDYLRISQIHKQLQSPTVLALTATATPEVQEDIIKSLQLDNIKKLIYPMDKPNIAIIAEHLDRLNDKQKRTLELVREYKVPTLIYFSSRQEAERIALYLQKNLRSRRIAYYHGGLDNYNRLLIQQQFMYNQLDVICCTNAFGMGIDKKDIQLVIHYHLPNQIESFIQEIGRAGREGQEAVSVTLYHESDRLLTSRLIEIEFPSINTVRELVASIFNQSAPLQQHREAFLLDQNNQESHWRFLMFQLETLGIIRDNEIFVGHTSYEATLQFIQKKIYDRFHYKNSKREEMLRWINTSACRRIALFKHFQEEVRSAAFMCCDHCNFQWKNWQPADSSIPPEEINWLAKLRGILYQGETP